MSGKLIATIYFYILSLVGVALMIIGVFNTVNFIVNSTQYPEYPLRYMSISGCDYPTDGTYIGPYTKPVMAPNETTPSAEEVKKNKEVCLKNEAADRKQHQVDDIKNSITFTLVGLVLFLIHFPLARKQSRG